MAQHDYVIANQSGASFRADLNNGLAAIVSNNSGATAPSTTYAYQWWADTTAGQLKLRNGSNDGWIVIQELDGTMLMENGSAASPGLAFASDLDTGFYRIGANQLGIATNGTAAVAVDASQRVGIGSSSPVSALTVVGSAGSGDAGVQITSGSTTTGSKAALFLLPSTTPSFSTGSAIKSERLSPDGCDLQFFTVSSLGNSPVRAMTIDSSQRVGIGSTAPSQLLEIKGANARFAVNSTTVADGGILLQGNGTTYAEIKLDASSGILDIAEKQAAGNITFSTGTAPTERFRCDSSGRLLVGTSSARDNFYNSTGEYPAVQIEGTDYNKASLAITLDVNTVTAPRLVFGKTRGGSIGSNTIVQSGDQVGVLSFQGSDGTNLVDAARIQCEVDGTPGADDMPGRIVLSTTADGASSPSERMRIRSSGEVLVNSTALLDLAGQSFQVNGWSMFHQTTSGVTASAFTHTASSTQTVCLFRQGAPATTVGSITVSGGTSTAFNTASDYRLKENITAVTDGINRLQQLKPSRFNFIANPDNTVDGFIAHEVQDVVPEAITGEKDAVDDKGNPIYQGIDQSKLVPLLTAALQEAVAKIESLEARLTAAGI